MTKPQPKYLELTPEQLEKIAKRKRQDEVAKVTPEWRLLAEFGYYYGWQAVRDVRNNDIDIDSFNNLIAGARKVWAGQLLDLSTMFYTSMGATKSKKPQSFINRGLASFIKEVKP